MYSLDDELPTREPLLLCCDMHMVRTCGQLVQRQGMLAIAYDALLKDQPAIHGNDVE